MNPDQSTETTPTAALPQQEIIRETIQARHEFTDAERLTLSDQLIQSMKSQDQIQAEFDSIKAEFKGRIEKAQLETDSIRGKLSDGFEMRPTIARILFNKPVSGRKTYVRDDNEEVIREEAMTLSDQQRPLFKDTDGKDALEVGDSIVAAEPIHEDAGETPLGEAIDAAAASTEQPKLLMDLSAADYTVSGLLQSFRKAAKTAGWPEAAISTVRDQLKACSTVSAMKDLLRPHCD